MSVGKGRRPGSTTSGPSSSTGGGASPSPGKVTRTAGFVQRKAAAWPAPPSLLGSAPKASGTEPPIPEPPLLAPFAGAEPPELTAPAVSNDAIVQRRESAGADHADPAEVQQTAAWGVLGGGGPLPHLETIQAAFGEHDVSHVQAHVGGDAAAAAGAIGAEAYATGDHVAFAAEPDLHTAAHEAAHVVQQRQGVQLYGGVGRAEDAHEQQADAVADAVVAGRSVAGLLGTPQGGHAYGGPPITQRKAARSHSGDKPDGGEELAILQHAHAVAHRALRQQDQERASVDAQLVFVAHAVIRYLDTVENREIPSGEATLLSEIAAVFADQSGLMEQDAGDVQYAMQRLLRREFYPLKASVAADPKTATTDDDEALAHASLGKALSALQTAIDSAPASTPEEIAAYEEAASIAVRELVLAEDLLKIVAATSAQRALKSFRPVAKKLRESIDEIDAFVRASKMPWSYWLRRLYELEADILGAVSYEAPSRAFGDRTDPDAVADMVRDPGKSGGDTEYTTKDAAIGAIAGSVDTYCQMMRDKIDDLRDVLTELAPRQDSLADAIFQAALQFAMARGIGALASSFASSLRELGHTTTSGASALESRISEVGALAVSVAGGEATKEGESAPQEGKGTGFTFIEPKNAFLSSMRDAVTDRESDLKSAVLGVEDELAKLDLDVLNQVVATLLKKPAKDAFKSQFAAELMTQWMNFSARWTSGSATGSADASIAGRLDDERRGFIIIDVNLHHHAGPNAVRATFHTEDGVKNSIATNKALANMTLDQFQVHRVFLLSFGAYQAIRIGIGPSGIPNLSEVTDDDLDMARRYLADDNVTALATFTKEKATARLVEIALDAARSLTLREAVSAS